MSGNAAAGAGNHVFRLFNTSLHASSSRWAAGAIWRPASTHGCSIRTMANPSIPAASNSKSGVLAPVPAPWPSTTSPRAPLLGPTSSLALPTLVGNITSVITKAPVRSRRELDGSNPAHYYGTNSPRKIPGRRPNSEYLLRIPPTRGGPLRLNQPNFPTHLGPE